MSWHGYDGFREYVPVAQRRANARREMDALRKQGKTIEPVEIEGRTIAHTFWGKGWCDHLESFSDFDNRLPRGRTYVRNGSVCHLAVTAGRIEAYVSGSEIYAVDIGVEKCDAAAWDAIKRRCAGQVGSMLELLQGKISERVMSTVTDRRSGLFPQPDEIKLNCSCLDWATMCKHVAAALYGVGRRLDEQPDLLFMLRGVDPQELIATNLTLHDQPGSAAPTLADDQLSDVFGIELDNAPPAAPSAEAADAKPPRNRKKTKPKKTKRRKAQPKQIRNRQAPDADQPLPRLRPTGKSVARLRRQLGLSAIQFAEQLGVSALTIYRWETSAGRLRLQPGPLRALARLKQRAANP